MSDEPDEVTITEAESKKESRRRFLKGAAYAAPVLLTLAAAPAFAQTGSGPPINCPPGSTPVFLPGYGWGCFT